MSKTSWGLVLAGGGGKGSYQIGVWKALKELGVDAMITAVSGASVGALNTALIGTGDYEKAFTIWSRIKPAQFLELEYGKDLAGDGKKGVFSREGLIQIMENDLDLRLVSNSQKALYANASRIGGENMEPEYFLLNEKQPEQIEKILLASSALPVIYEPIDINGNKYLDGGLTDNLPILPLFMLGYKKMIVVGLGKELEILEDKFPEVSFIKINPSKNLGGLLKGTLDFTDKDVISRMELGYQDTVKVILQNSISPK